MAVFICYITLYAGLQSIYSSSVSYCWKKLWKIYLLVCFESSKHWKINVNINDIRNGKVQHKKF